MGMGGAVGGVSPDDLPQIVADLVMDREASLEIWIRPERIGHGYTIEWTTVEFDQQDQEWRPPGNRPEGSKDGQEPSQTASDPFGDPADNEQRRSTFDMDRDPVNVFVVDDRYLFKAYFDEDAVFDELRPYYNGDDYRFEVPQGAFNDVRNVLEQHCYEPVVIRDLEPFCVVYPKYRDHPGVLFKTAVLQWSHGDRHVFLLRHQLAVDQAVNQGATSLADSEIDDTGI